MEECIGPFTILSRHEHDGHQVVYVRRDGFAPVFMLEAAFWAEIQYERRARWARHAITVVAALLLIVLVAGTLANADPGAIAGGDFDIWEWLREWLRIRWPLIWVENIRAGSEA